MTLPSLNPYTWLIGALVAVLILGGTFGAGFYTATKVYVKASASAATVAAKAQQHYDLKAHDIALHYDLAAGPVKIVHDTKVVRLVQVIHETSPAVCALPPNVADALNKAGVY
jgi:hypothetical protein